MTRSEFVKALSILSVSMTPASKKITDLLLLTSSIPSNTEQFPLLFFGHGDPANAFRDNSFTKHVRAVGSELNTVPLAVLVISGHYLTEKQTYLKVQPFFDNPYYPVKGASEFTDLLIPDYNIALDPYTNLDHGAWIILNHLFPEKNVPVIEISMPMGQPLGYHWEMATRLRKLREKGVLIVGSGNVVHNLEFALMKKFMFSRKPFDWALEMDAWVKNNLDNQDWEALLNYQSKGKLSRLAINAADHYLPMIYIVAMMDVNEYIVHTYEEVYSSISMRSFMTKVV